MTSAFYNIYQWSSPSYREKFSSSHADETNLLLLIDKSLKKINKYINKDLLNVQLTGSEQTNYPLIPAKQK